MAVEIAPIKGLIELQDEYTDKLHLAEFALQHFTKENQESLKAVAGAVGIVTAGIVAITAATIELGKRGSDVNSLNDTIEHFGGSSKAAAEDMEALRRGTKNTVDDFNLAKDAAHLLSAGVKLTADDFGTLGQAAFVLQNRGLGGTKQQLDLVSDALITGRTKALSAALGVIDLGDAQENLAKKLGMTKELLSDTGRAEAARIQVMAILNSAVKDAGVQERDFAQELEAAQSSITNWVDKLAGAVAKSDVFNVGLKTLEGAVSQAFGDDKSASIKKVVDLIEDGAIKMLDFATVGVQGAKVVEGAWNVLRTVVLGLETGVVAVAAHVVDSLSLVTDAAAKVHIISPGTAQEVRDTAQSLGAMTEALAAQTKEAAQGVFGHTKFDDTLDHLSVTLQTARQNMQTAKDATGALTEAGKKGTDGAKDAKKAQDELNASFLDQEKIQKLLEKSTRELTAIQADYAAQVIHNSRTTGEAQRADIESTFLKSVASLDKQDLLYKEKYAAFRKIADESLKAVGVNWDEVQGKSREALQEQADNALDTYHKMRDSSLHFSRDVMEEQYLKWRDLQDAVSNYGLQGTHAVQTIDDEMHKLIQTMNDAAEAMKRLSPAGQIEVNKGNFFNTLQNIITSFGHNPAGIGSKIDINFAGSLAQKGYSLQEILDFFNTGMISPTPIGPRIPGFASGGEMSATGMALVGESGPELVRLPGGSHVYPSGIGPDASNVTNNFYINGTAADVARQVSDVIMRTLKSQRQFTAA